MEMNRFNFNILIMLAWLSVHVAESQGGPQNIAVIKGATVSLKCRFGTSWRFYSVKSNSSNTILTRSGSRRPHPGRYAAGDSSGNGTNFDLLILDTTSEDAGKYYCIALKQYTAELIIFDSKPKCHLSNEMSYANKDSVLVKENDVVEMSCTLNFWGNWAPTMEWRIQGRGEVIKSDTYESHTTNPDKTLKSSNTLRVDASMSDVRVTCRTFFVENNKPVEKSGATNVPDLSLSWESPVIRIQAVNTLEKGTQNKTTPEDRNKNTTILLAACLGVSVIGLIIAGVALSVKCKANNPGEIQVLKTVQFTTEGGGYCEINEAAMEQAQAKNPRKGRKARDVVFEKESSFEQLAVAEETNIEPITPGFKPVDSFQTEEQFSECVYENNMALDEATYENTNVEAVYCEVDGSHVGISTTVGRGKKTNKNYIDLDPSTREEISPPSVYKRLKSTKTNKIIGAPAAQYPSTVMSHEIGEHGRSTVRGKPKLPTPEQSSSSSES